MSTEELAVDEAEHDGDGYHEEGGEEEPLEHDEPYQFLEAGLTAFLPSRHLSLIISPLFDAARKLWSPAMELRRLLLMLGPMEKQWLAWRHPRAFWPHITSIMYMLYDSGWKTWFSIAYNFVFERLVSKGSSTTRESITTQLPNGFVAKT